MFSKIEDIIKPFFLKKEASDRPGQKHGRGKQGNDTASEEAADDVALFSTEAIRGMLKQSDATMEVSAEEVDRLLAGLEALERQDIVSIPVRPGQSVFAAAAAAISCLRT